MAFDLTDESHPTLFKGVQFYIWPTRWAKLSEELAFFIRRKGGKCYDWHALDLKHDELIARAKTPGFVLVDPTEKGAPALLGRKEGGDLRFVSWAYPWLCAQSGEMVTLKKAAKRLLFARLCDGTPYGFYFDCDRAKPQELRQMGELKIQFVNHGGKVVEDPRGADTIITTKDGDAFGDLRVQYSFATQTRVETFDWLKSCLTHTSWSFSPPLWNPLGGRPPKKKASYTQEEDSLLVKYLAECTEGTEGRQGQILFKRLVTLGETDATYSWVKRHSWQSWRNRYVKPERKEAFDNLIREYQDAHPRAQTDGHGTYPYKRRANKRSKVPGVNVHIRKRVEEEVEVDEVDELDELDELDEQEVDELDSDEDAELQQEQEQEHSVEEHRRQHQHDIPVPREALQEGVEYVEYIRSLVSCSPLTSVPPNSEDGADANSKQGGSNFVGESHIDSPPPPSLQTKRQREPVDGSEESEDAPRRKRRKTDLTQVTLVNSTQYNPFRDSPLSKAAVSVHALQSVVTPRLPALDFSKTRAIKRKSGRPLRGVDSIFAMPKRRDSLAQRIADQTFDLENENEEVEETESVIRFEVGSRLPRRHQEERLDEVPELQAPNRQRKSRLNPDSIPAVTYQIVRTGVTTRSQSRAETPLNIGRMDRRTSTRNSGRVGSQRRGDKRY